MTILLTGGGTGGHITPILAVAHELKKIQPDCRIIYVGEKNGKYASLLDDNKDVEEIRQIYAGKFRRYNGESFITRILDIKTLLFNLRDFFMLIVGLVQSVFMVRKINPDIVFLKGGFVGVPIGLACALWRIPFMTHDSDALPGLANRIVGRWAKVHATGMPAGYYDYPEQSVRHVGVLVESHYEYVDSKQQLKFKQQLKLPDDSKLLMITGGSGGAQVINQEIAKFAEFELEKNPDLFIVHQVGIGKAGVYENFSHPRLQVFELLKNMYVYSGAADVIVTRAGANTIAEFGVQAKACIVVPNPLLTGGHQLLNAKYLEEKDAAVIIAESNLGDSTQSVVWDNVNSLLGHNDKAAIISKNLHTITLKDASVKLANILLSLAK